MKLSTRLILVSIFPVLLSKQLYAADNTETAIKQQHQDLQLLVETANTFLLSHLDGIKNDGNSQLDLRVVAPDKRLKLSHCDQKIDAFFPYKPTGMRSVSVGLRCTGQVRWKVFLQAHLKRFKKLAHLNTSVAAGQTLTDGMISMRETDIYEINHTGIEDYSELVGQVFNKNVQHETPLSIDQLELPVVINKGDYVRILSNGGGVKVSAYGDALSDGYRMKAIKVKNTTSGKIVNAIVVEAGVVRSVK